MEKAVILDIQHFSIHDGPGIRTTVFLKGCHFGCEWCHNPESQDPFPELMFYRKRCIQCGRCLAVCRKGAHDFSGGHEMDLSKCRRCPDMGHCAEACPSEAITLCGREMTSEEVLAEAMKDRDFYAPDGGVTFSGGEPLLQLPFLQEVLRGCKEKGIHTCIDTTLEVPTEELQRILEDADLFLADVKILNPEKAQAYMKKTYQYLFSNLELLAKKKIPVIIRVPLCRGVNDTEEEVLQRQKLLKRFSNIVRIDEFYVNDHARSKYEALQRRICHGLFL